MVMFHKVSRCRKDTRIVRIKATEAGQCEYNTPMAPTGNRVRARAVASAGLPDPVTDQSILQAYLEDASGRSPGRATGLLRPSGEGEVAAWLRATASAGVTVLPQAARSSLTGGAVPEGDVVISVERMADVGPVVGHPGGARVTVGAGVRLIDLQAELAGAGFYYPPVPTYQEAMIGGTVSTNAGGAATFKYGVTREWIHALRVLLWNGDMLEVERGECVARPGGKFHIGISDGGELVVPVPEYTLPALKKLSAGYYSSDPLDLVDLFVGAEGTLGLITGVTLNLVPLPPSVVTGLAFVTDSNDVLPLAGSLRDSAMAARNAGDPLGPDIRAIEFIGGSCLDLLRIHGDTGRLRVTVPDDARSAILFEMEIPERMSNEDVLDILEGYLEERTGLSETPVLRLFRILANFDTLDTMQFAFPEDRSRRETLMEFREAAPKRVNEIMSSRRGGGVAVKKVGGDLIVPFEHLGSMLRLYEEEF